MFAAVAGRLLRAAPATPALRAFSGFAGHQAQPSVRRVAIAGAAAAVAAAALYASEQRPQASKWFDHAKNEQLVMSGDCGGTNTRLRIFRVPSDAPSKLRTGSKPPGVIVFEKKYQNSKYPSFEEVCKVFLQEAAEATGGVSPASCCLACAGAIVNNTVNFTNVKTGWFIDGYKLQETLGILKVLLINDFVAQGYGLLTLEDSDKELLNSAKPEPGAPIACVGAGTGLGECYLTMSGAGEYTCWPSEGGHTEFSPRSPLTEDLFEFLKTKHAERKRVSVERVISGPGLASIYEFLRQHWAYEKRTDPAIDAKFNEMSPDMRGAVVADGFRTGDATCLEAVAIFSECYGSEAGAAALKWLPKGGLFISGGIAAKNPGWVKSDEFMFAYSDKGRLSDQVKQTPLYLVLADDCGERGAQYVAVQLLNQVNLKK